MDMKLGGGDGEGIFLGGGLLAPNPGGWTLHWIPK